LTENKHSCIVKTVNPNCKTFDNLGQNCVVCEDDYSIYQDISDSIVKCSSLSTLGCTEVVTHFHDSFTTQNYTQCETCADFRELSADN
jgi:hypothetical protein